MQEEESGLCKICCYIRINSTIIISSLLLEFNMLKFNYLIFFLFYLLSNKISVAQSLNQIKPFIPESSRLINQTSITASEIIKNSQKSIDYKIPSDWKLVSVVPLLKNSNDQEIMLFFQDGKGNVHSIGMTVSGIITGKNTLEIKVQN